MLYSGTKLKQPKLSTSLALVPSSSQTVSVDVSQLFRSHSLPYIVTSPHHMAAETFISASGANQTPYGFTSSQPLSPMSQPSNPFDAAMAIPAFSHTSERHNSRTEPNKVSAILMRKLPRNTSNEALRSMLLFAKDLIGAEFVSTENTDDKGYLSAIARFRTPSAAQEARAMLDGKTNTANEAKMIVEVLHFSPSGNLGTRRNTYDVTYNRGATSSSSSAGSSNGQNTRQSSRYNGTFQAMDGISPSGGLPSYNASGGQGNGEVTTLDTNSAYHKFYSPTSPIGHPLERQRISGKSVIGEDGVDDETGELLKDPLAYARNDGINQLSRRATNPHIPTSSFVGLNLNNNGMTSPPIHGYTSPRSAAPLQSPTTVMSPSGVTNVGPNATYQLANQHYQRHNYPPVNPADQNPPCNTLYVGNLPIDTSEDELKAMFSKQRGYKRMCFRTKQNGPMCFVEFEDVSFATKALNELYGHPLHNSVKGGIRLSFSKNPLGVRTGQPGGLGLQTTMSPQGSLSGMNGLGSMQSFSTANGPPPGLAAPPGLSTNGGSNNGSMSNLGSPTGAGMMGNPFSTAMNPMNNMGISGMTSPHLNNNMALATNGMWSSHGGLYPDYMVGR